MNPWKSGNFDLHFIRNFFSTHYKHFNLISFHDQRSHFIAYTSLRLRVIKFMCEICDKNISNKKYEKLRNY